MFAAKLGDKTKQWYWHVLNWHLGKMLLWSTCGLWVPQLEKRVKNNRWGFGDCNYFLIFAT